MEIVHVWMLDDKGRIVFFREYNDTYAMAAAFDYVADPELSLVANPADYGIPTSSYTDTLQAGVAFYAAFGRADFDYFIANTDPELVLILAGPPSITPFAGTFYGIEGTTDFIVRVFTTERFFDLQFKSFTVDGSRLDAEFREVVSVYATGKTFICEGLHTFIVSDEGKLRSFRSYNDTYSVAMGFTPSE
jgi:ketosteroid isomerase-like protein